MRSLWIVVRFIVLGTTLYVLKHRVWPGHAAAAAPLRVTVGSAATASDVEAAIDSAILLEAAVGQGALFADPVVREELLRSMRALPTMADSDERTMLEEAVRLNLHALDPVVRERLRFAGEQLLLAEQRALPAQDAELADYFGAHADRYREAGSVSVRIVALRGQDSEALEHARSVRTQLLAEPALDLHELPMVPTRLLGATTSTLAQRLGRTAAPAIEALAVGAWSEPLMTPYGFVLARMLARSPAELPPFTRVRERVAADLAHDLRARSLASVLRSAREGRAVDVVRTP